jgi:hypothetical protein
MASAWEVQHNKETGAYIHTLGRITSHDLSVPVLQ